jgi:hypothetical protein
MLIMSCYVPICEHVTYGILEKNTKEVRDSIILLISVYKNKHYEGASGDEAHRFVTDTNYHIFFANKIFWKKCFPYVL